VARVLRKDTRELRTHWAAGDSGLASVYALSVAAETVDVLAQAALTVGMGATSGLLPHALLVAAAPPALLAALPALLAVADKVSLVCASVSCGAGLLAEGVKAQRADEGSSAPSSDDESASTLASSREGRE
jgi:hypothetical protein